MTPPTTIKTREIFDLYCRLTGLQARYSMHTHFTIEAWMAHGNTAKDLEQVIAYIWRRIKAGKRERESFKLCNLIGDPARWDDDLSIARAEASGMARKGPQMPAGRANVLRSSGRPQIAPERPTRTPAQIMGSSPSVPQLIQQLRDAVK